MLERPESLYYFLRSKNVEDWIISRQPSQSIRSGIQQFTEVKVVIHDPNKKDILIEEALRGHTPNIRPGGS